MEHEVAPDEAARVGEALGKAPRLREQQQLRGAEAPRREDHRACAKLVLATVAREVGDAARAAALVELDLARPRIFARSSSLPVVSALATWTECAPAFASTGQPKAEQRPPFMQALRPP